VTHPLKQFTARDRVSRWDTLELRANARAGSAVGILDALAARMPFPVRAISVDNGSEFMAEFELACQARGIALFNLPPRSPKLHGSVERANRTHTEEFYEVTDAEPELAPASKSPRPGSFFLFSGGGACFSALGVGALLGATAGAAIGRGAAPGRLIITSGLAIGVIQLFAAATRSLGLVAAEMAVLGAVSVLFANASASTVQTNAEPQLRGRVMSVYALVETGTLPVGNAFAGAVMAAWGAPMGFLLGGGVSIVLLLAIAALQWSVIRRSLFQRA
jgi:hypothetical protein